MHIFKIQKCSIVKHFTWFRYKTACYLSMDKSECWASGLLRFWLLKICMHCNRPQKWREKWESPALGQYTWQDKFCPFHFETLQSNFWDLMILIEVHRIFVTFENRIFNMELKWIPVEFNWWIRKFLHKYFC